mgnify:CR=1 FL=1
MIILGIDPGYAIVGYGVIELTGGRIRVLDFGAVTTEAGVPFPDRLKTIYEDLMCVFAKYSPDCMAIEKLFYNTNAKTVIDVAQARGVILLCAQKHGLEISEYTPLQVKQSVVGYGKAVKKQVKKGNAQKPKAMLKTAIKEKWEDTEPKKTNKNSTQKKQKRKSRALLYAHNG